jgi:tRNA 2-thiouridine synthesizing protein A
MLTPTKGRQDHVRAQEMTDNTLDARGLLCPLPVLRANKSLRALAVGDELKVMASDPSAPADFRSFCETAGHDLLDSREEEGVFVITLRKGR